MEQLHECQSQQQKKKDEENLKKMREESWLRFLSKKGKGYLKNPSPDCHLHFD